MILIFIFNLKFDFIAKLVKILTNLLYFNINLKHHDIHYFFSLSNTYLINIIKESFISNVDNNKYKQININNNILIRHKLRNF